MGCAHSAKTHHLDEEERDVFSMDPVGRGRPLGRRGSRRSSSALSRHASGARSPTASEAGGAAFITVTAGVVKDRSGKNAGRLDKQGSWFNASNDKRGSFKGDGSVRDKDGATVARIDDDGHVFHAKRKAPIGKIGKDGSVLAGSSVVGHVTADGAAFDARGRRVGMCSAGKAQAAFIFFFDDRLHDRATRTSKSYSK